MRMKIYDYENRPVEVDLPDKEIKAIIVQVLTGDETGCVLFEDDSELAFDASTERVTDYDDGAYLVKKEHLAEWLGWKPEETPWPLYTCAYARRNWYKGFSDD